MECKAGGIGRRRGKGKKRAVAGVGERTGRTETVMAQRVLYMLVLSKVLKLRDQLNA